MSTAMLGPREKPGRRTGVHTLFSVPFHARLSDDDLHRLAAELGLDLDIHSSLPPGTVSPGFRRLDFGSGLFLLRHDEADEWRLEARTWGDPAPESVHAWQLWASAAARIFDPAVPSAEPSP